MQNTILQQMIDPSHRAVAASALALYTAKRFEGWNISGCVAAVDFDTPVAVDEALKGVADFSNEQLIEVIAGLMRSVVSGPETSANHWFEMGKQIGLKEAPSLCSDDLVAIEDFFSKPGIPASSLIDTDDRFYWVIAEEVRSQVPDDGIETFYSGVFEGIREYSKSVTIEA